MWLLIFVIRNQKLGAQVILTNPEGTARIMIAGIEFRIRVKQTEYAETQIDYINVRHQRSDKRFLRGPLSEQPDQGVV